MAKSTPTEGNGTSGAENTNNTSSSAQQGSGEKDTKKERKEGRDEGGDDDEDDGDDDDEDDQPQNKRAASAGANTRRLKAYVFFGADPLKAIPNLTTATLRDVVPEFLLGVRIQGVTIPQPSNRSSQSYADKLTSQSAKGMPHC